MVTYGLLLHEETYRRAAGYLDLLRSGECAAGACLREMAASRAWQEQTVPDFLELLVNSKRPRMFAESEIVGDGRDWNQRELSLLGDVVFVVPVTVFDNGLHQSPAVHEEPFAATLFYVPGALLRNDHGFAAADWQEVTENDTLDMAAYTDLYERRLLPALFYASELAGGTNKRALVTVPGLGCGLFAGRFRGRLGAALRDAIGSILERHQQQLAHIRAVYYDPYREAENERREIGPISYLVRPLMKGNEHRPQLCPPSAYAEQGDDFADCELFSFVAWDHVSWPGNDFYVGSRTTDDGVKAAATDSMAVITGVAGTYHRERFRYEPPQPYKRWQDVVRAKKLALRVRDNFALLACEDGELHLRQVMNG